MYNSPTRATGSGALLYDAFMIAICVSTAPFMYLQVDLIKKTMTIMPIYLYQT